MKFKSLFILLIILMGGFVLPQQLVQASTESTTSPTAFGYNFQRHAFNATGLTWYWFSDGTDMVWTTSSKFVTNGAIHVAVAGVTSGNLFSVFANTNYCAYVRVTTAGKLYYRYGVPQSDGTIIWSIVEKQITTIHNHMTAPSVCMDENGRLWVGFCDANGIIGGNATFTSAYVMRGEFSNFTVGSTMPILLENSTSAVQYGVCPTPTDNDFVIVAYGSDTTALKTKSFNANFGTDGEPIGSIIKQGIKTLASVIFSSGHDTQSEDCSIQLNSISSFTASATRSVDGSGPNFGTFKLYYSDYTTLSIKVPINGNVLSAIYTYNAAHGISNTKTITKIQYTTDTMWETLTSYLSYYVDGTAPHNRYGGDNYYSGNGTINYIKTPPATFVWHTYVNGWYYTTNPITAKDIIYYNFTAPLSSTKMSSVNVTYQTDPSHTLQLNCTVVYSDGSSTKTVINAGTNIFATSAVSFVSGKSVTSFVIRTNQGSEIGIRYHIWDVLFKSKNKENTVNNVVNDASTDGNYIYETSTNDPPVIKKLTADGLFYSDVWQYNATTTPANSTLVYDGGFLYIGIAGVSNLAIVIDASFICFPLIIFFYFIYSKKNMI